MTELRQPIHWPRSVTLYLCCLLILWLPIPLGSNRPWAESVLCIAAAFLLVLWCIECLIRGHDLRRTFNPGLLLLVGFNGWIFLQTMPLPANWVASLSPTSHALWAMIQAQDAMPITVDTYLTGRRLWLSLAFLMLFWIVQGLSTDRLHRVWLLAAVLVTATAQALIGNLLLLGQVSWSWMGEQIATDGGATGTYPSRDHFAGLMTLGGAAGFALLVTGKPMDWGGSWKAWVKQFLDWILSPKILLRVFLAVILIGAVLSRSRGGVTAFFTGLAMAAFCLLLLRRVKEGRRSVTPLLILLLSVLILDLWVISHWFGLDKVVDRIQKTEIATETRVDAYPAFPAMLRDYWLTGAGLGSFEYSFQPYRPLEMPTAFIHAHNDYVEFAAETGVVGVVLLGGLLLWLTIQAIKSLRTSRSSSRIAAALAWIYALSGYLWHSAVDFNLQIPANAAIFLVLAGLVAVKSHRTSS